MIPYTHHPTLDTILIVNDTIMNCNPSLHSLLFLPFHFHLRSQMTPDAIDITLEYPGDAP
jgi:hypothetical protein